MQYVANILFPTTKEYVRYAVKVNHNDLEPWARAHLRACRIAEKAAKKNHCYAKVTYEEAGCETRVAKEYDFTEKYDE